VTQKVLFDSSVYVQAWREKRTEVLISRAWKGSLIYLSAVVGSEILRGARDAAAKRDTRRLWRDYAKVARLVIPGAGDWHDAGVVLAKIAAKYGYEAVGQARLVYDTLIALSARRRGITVVTFNVKDFERIAEFRSFRLLSALPEET
jgi:predicted nucleic acid-binding protein